MRIVSGQARRKWMCDLIALVALAFVGLAPELTFAQSGRVEIPPLPPQPNLAPPSELVTDPMPRVSTDELPVLRPSDLGSSRPGLPSFVESLSDNDAAFQVVMGQSRILTVKEDLTAGPEQALVAVGDPTVADFTIVSPRQIRVTGGVIGVTDLSVTTAKGHTFSFEIRVVADLKLLEGQLRQTFPDASLKLGQIRDHVIIEGEARDTAQVARILEMTRSYLRSIAASEARKIRGGSGGSGLGLPGTNGDGAMRAGGGASAAANSPVQSSSGGPTSLGNLLSGGVALPNLSSPLQAQTTVPEPQIINLLRVPGAQQVLLQVRVAELNRTAFRRIGANFLGVDPKTGAIVGSQITSSVNGAGLIGNVESSLYTPGRDLGGAVLSQVASINSQGGSTIFGIFDNANFMFLLNAYRRNNMLRILAEPNLVALHGHQASFLAGGEFPVPVPQVSASGVAPTITVQFKEFGVRLGFVPFILDDERIRLMVSPEVSNIDFTIATTLVSGGSPVPGLNVRRAQSTVELHEGQTLAIAGLLQLNLSGSTERIPGLGDLPIIGPFFSNTTGERVEKELVVLVTPYLIEPMNPNQVPPTPGDEIKEPNDLEFFLLNRIEGRTGKDFRSTTRWDDVWGILKLMHLEQSYVEGPVGYSDPP